jgi:hypothetical protein
MTDLPANLDEIKRLLGAATPTPWHFEPKGWISGPEHKGCVADCSPTFGAADADEKANAALIVALVNSAPAMVAELERLRAKAALYDLAISNGWKEMAAFNRAQAAETALAACQARVGELEGALEPFADLCARLERDCFFASNEAGVYLPDDTQLPLAPQAYDDPAEAPSVTMDKLRHARAALHPTKAETSE